MQRADAHMPCAAPAPLTLVVGTHKLLQKTVKFKDLGLLIVDEEQRFGVTHKERLKELSQGCRYPDALCYTHSPHA